MEIQELVKELARQETQDALTKIIALIYDSHNYRLKLAAIVQAFGLPLFHGKTQKEIAEDHGVTKQALSKSIKRFQKEFDLPICSGQKSLEACENYRKSALRRHHDV